MSKIKLLLIFIGLCPAVFGISVRAAAQGSPAIFYADLTAGPNTGGQGNNGVFVTIWGNNFGTSQGSSYITVGGGRVNNYPTWTNTMVCFQLGPNAASGNIELVTAGGTAGGPAFTVQQGNIYFVQPGAAVDGNGSYENPFNHLLSFESMANPGDTVYVRAGTINDEINGHFGYHSLLAPERGGLEGDPVSWIAYPNEKVTLQADGGVQSWPADGNDYVQYIFRGYTSWHTVSKFTMVLGGTGALSAVDMHANGWKLVGNDITASIYIYAIVGLGGNHISILGNEIHDSGNDTYQNKNHSIYWDGAGSAVEIAWNYLHDNKNTGWEISCFHQGTRSGAIHDNRIFNPRGYALKGILLGDVDTGEDKTTVEGQDIEVYNNVLYNLGYNEYGGAIQAVSGTAYIYHNTIYQSPESKGTLQFPSGGTGPGGGHPAWYVANNIIVNSLPHALYLSDSDGNPPDWTDFPLLTNNNYYGAGNGPVQDPNPVNADPQFVDGGKDFQLGASSPDINAGYNTMSNVVQDINGHDRNVTPTIGAYEYAGRTPAASVLPVGSNMERMVVKAAVRIKHALTGKPQGSRYNAVAPVSARDGAAVFAASSLDRIFQDGKTLLKPAFSPRGILTLAKNEYASLQIVVQSQGGGLGQVELKLSDLINNKTGYKIDQKNISWRIVGYVPTVEPDYPVQYVGLWPDPLLPSRRTDIKPGATQPFWVTVHTLPETRAGDYEGQVAVMADNKIIGTVPLSIHVYDFELPKTSSLKTAFDFFSQLTALRYPRQPNEKTEDYNARIKDLDDQFLLTMLDYRMDPLLNTDPSSSTDLASLDRYLVNGLDNFAIGKRGGAFRNNWPRDDKSIEELFSLYRTYGEDLKLNSLLSYAYVYLWDEGKMGDPLVAKIASMVHRAYPGLRTMVDYQGIWDTADGAQWIKDIDIWAFQVDDFNEQKMRKLQAMGKEIWMYISGPSQSGVPNLAIDFDPMDYRIIPWLCWKYDIKGFLYWCVNYWPHVDPFASAGNTPSWGQNGNGLLFYPGKEGPVASLRMEIFRDGMEDYEYIQLLYHDLKTLKKMKMDKRRQQFFEDSLKLLTVDNYIAASMSQFTKEGGALMARRNAIARKIEEFRGL